MKYKIIMLGSQGSGKGTQSELISEKLKIPAVSMGNLLRTEKKKGGKLGKELASFMNKGLLVPHEITIKLIKKALKKSKKGLACRSTAEGIIVDGFPRDMEQVKSFEKFFEPTHIVFIKISSKETMRRLGGRRVCSKCNENYHLVFKKPKKKNLCDKCKESLKQRDDDKPKAIKKRLEIFRKNTMPVIRFYKKKYGTIEINGEQSIKKVHKDVEKALKNRS